MSDQSQGPGWWVASDGRWYPPESHPSYVAPPPPDGDEPTRRRRRWPWLVLVLLLLAGGIGAAALLAADDDEHGDEARPSTTTTTTERRSTTTERSTTTTTTRSSSVPVGERVETTRGNVLQVYSFAQPVTPDESFITASPGMEYAVIDVEGCAGPRPDDGLALNPFQFELQMPDNTRLTPTTSVRQPALNHTDLPFAGDCVRGFVSFEVPVGLRPTFILFTATDEPVRWSVPTA